MQKVLGTASLVEHANQMIDCFSSLLEQSDVSSYESNKRAGKTNIMDEELEQDLPLSQEPMSIR